MCRHAPSDPVVAKDAITQMSATPATGLVSAAAPFGLYAGDFNIDAGAVSATPAVCSNQLDRSPACSALFVICNRGKNKVC